ncbi:hypothetical protein AB0K74_44720, partial [Streptomyces sp. NPDC056159]|uniref:hypothetical protein n=1 Tax=Streptomyces sp. NPDC056159 TaxID=3155537 RepID=UPI003437EB35
MCSQVVLDRAARRHLQDSLHCDVDLVRHRDSIRTANDQPNRQSVDRRSQGAPANGSDGEGPH